MKKWIIFIIIVPLLLWWCDTSKQNAEESARQEVENLYNNAYSQLQIVNQNGVNYYYNSYFTHKENENRLSIYICRYYENNPYVRLKISSNMANVVHADYIYLYADDKTMEIPLGDIYKVTKVKGGAYVDLMIGNMLTEHLLDMAKAINASVRFYGYNTGVIQEYYITQDEKQAISQITHSFTYLKSITKP